MDGYPCRHCEASRIHVTHKHATQHQSVVVVHIISTPLQLKTLRPTLFKISLACLHNKQQRGGQWPRIGRFRDRRTDCVSQWTEMILHAFCMFSQVSFALSQSQRSEVSDPQVSAADWSYLYWCRSNFNSPTNPLVTFITRLVYSQPDVENFFVWKEGAFLKQVATHQLVNTRVFASQHNTPQPQVNQLLFPLSFPFSPLIHSPCGPRPNCGLSSVVEMTYIR